jgi:hypothetical protein
VIDPVDAEDELVRAFLLGCLLGAFVSLAVIMTLYVAYG